MSANASSRNTAKPCTSSASSITIRLLHFNDVYNIQERKLEPVGGAARFVSALRAESLPPKQMDGHTQGILPLLSRCDGLPAVSSSMVLFSGDCLSPSSLSYITKGSHMPPILNSNGANVAVACVGNHDLDFGIQNLERRLKEFDFPWLCSNARDIRTGKPLAGAKESHIIEKMGFRIGFVGIVSQDWLETLSCVDPGEIRYSDTVETADHIADELKRAHGCHMVIALTHMRRPDDNRLAANTKHVDLVLGGHDHTIDIGNNIRNIWVVKSGTDFVHFTTIDISVTSPLPDISTSAKPFTVAKPVLHTVSSNYEPDPEIARTVRHFTAELEKSRSVVVGYTAVALDGRFATVRTTECSLGNFIVDIITRVMRADVGMLNSGSLRSERIHQVGALTHGDLGDILPYDDEAVSVCLSGKQLLSALENSVSRYPAQEGRFCQVSGISFEFNSRKPPNERVILSSVRCRYQGVMEPLGLERRYRCAVKHYMLEGKDGFDALRAADSNSVIRNDSGNNLRVMVSNYLTDFHNRHNNGASPSPTDNYPRLSQSCSDRPDIQEMLDCGAPVLNCGHSSQSVIIGIAPRLEGRIRHVGSGN